jgi:hypothetical protein
MIEQLVGSTGAVHSTKLLRSSAVLQVDNVLSLELQRLVKADRYPDPQTPSVSVGVSTGRPSVIKLSNKTDIGNIEKESLRKTLA